MQAVLSGFDALRDRIRNVPRQVRFAAAGAINDVAFQVPPELRAEASRVFDRATPWVLSSFWVGKRAQADSLQAWIYPRDPGGKSVDPADVLRAEVFGGSRKSKRMERAFERAGLLPRGLAMVPGAAAPRDAYGNVPAGFIVQLISYFQAFGEQGYRANMSERRRGRLSGRGKWADGRFVAAGTRAYAKAKGAMAYRQGGVEYFVSRGRGEFTGRGSWKHGQQQHLPAGIWSRTGLYGAVVKPVFLFVRTPRYGKRLDMGGVVQRVAQAGLPARFAARLDQALKTARPA